MSLIGEMVLYTLTAYDAEGINRRRTDANRAKADGNHPGGTQTHVGNKVQEGNQLPMLIVADWGGSVNGQVFLDGNDTFWATSRARDESGKPGTWSSRQ